ncbi:MAG: ribonuclease P protein component [Clostridia bacterium]|nr:ribonuclease P protein component [Clostridia bacterium]
MLNKKNRLTKNRHFQYIYKKGSKVYGKDLYIVYATTKIKPCKVGVVVSNKVGKAVKRNKVKRRIRAIVNEILPKLKNDFNYIIVAKPEIIDLDFKKMKSEIYSVFKKGNLLNEDSN